MKYSSQSSETSCDALVENNFLRNEEIKYILQVCQWELKVVEYRISFYMFTSSCECKKQFLANFFHCNDTVPKYKKSLIIFKREILSFRILKSN